MYVKVFGGVSSGGCSNYALKKTSFENKNGYNAEAEHTL